MSFAPREYQQRTLDGLYGWWMEHPSIAEIPLMVLPTGAGKSIVLAELVRLLFRHWGADHPRTVILVPSKELAEQNAEKLRALLPQEITVGFYSAAIGRKEHWADVIVATIGSIYKSAHLLGNIKVVLIDEAHLVNPDGEEAGRFRQFLAELGRLCSFRVAGCTATPFRGNGVWLTDGDKPLFTGVSTTITMGELIKDGYLAPMVRPIDMIATRIDTDDIKTTSGDFNLHDLSERVEQYLPSAADEALRLAADRKKWIAFLPSVATAEHFSALLRERGIGSAVVCGTTPKELRATLIAQFRAGEIRCLVTVLALSTGFDVPDVDCVVWLRPTKSPVLYVQGAGRGMRISPGKIDCLWIDFSDTTDRLGPVDIIKGRKKRGKQEEQGAPYCICPNCGTQVRPANSVICPDCGAQIRDPEAEAREAAKASAAAILSAQLAMPRINTYIIKRVSYQIHKKHGSPDSLKVIYWGGILAVATEWICLDHEGYALGKAHSWWKARRPVEGEIIPGVAQAMDWINGGYTLRQPYSVTVNETGKYPEIVRFAWEEPANVEPLAA